MSEDEEPTPPPSHWRRVRRLWRHSRALLPINVDIEVTRTVVGVPVAIRLRPGFLALAALGGALGTLTRFLLTFVSPTWQSLSAGTVAVNVLGPFFLGVLIQTLSVGTETGFRRSLRLVVGVGFLGALTSYAELALDVVTLAERGNLPLAIAYGLGSIALGALATWVGIFAAARPQRRAARRTEASEPGQ